MTARKFGWRSGKLTCKDVLVTDTLEIRGAMTFGDASTDTLTVSGALTTTADVTFTLGSTEAFTLTCTDISAPVVMTNTVTTAGKTGARALFHVKTNVAVGAWVNAVKGYLEFTGTSGRTTGLASAIVAEMKMPNASLASGRYYPLEIEYVAGGTSTTTSGSAGSGDAGFMWLKQNSDDNGDFDDNGFLMCVTNMTAAANHLLSLTSQTLRCLVGTYGSESTRYLVLSQAEDNLTFGTTGTPMVLTTHANHAIDIYTTCASEDTGNSVRPIYMKSTMTGAGGVGGRAEFHMYTNVALGSWSNALKGYSEYGASGKTTGLGSAICGEILLSEGTTSGSYAPLESELVANSEVSTGTATSFLYGNIAGSNSTGKTTINTNGYLFELGTGVVSTEDGMFEEVEVTAAQVFDAVLRVRVGGANYFIGLCDDKTFA